MKIGIASDSLGNVDGLGRAFDVLMAAGAERIFFLGGRYGDVDAVLARKRSGSSPPGKAAGGDDGSFLGAVEGELAKTLTPAQRAQVDRLAGSIVRVASRACPEYNREDVPKKQIEMADMFICCLVHDKGELTRDDISNATVLFHGNSAQAGLVQIGPRFFVTPGHLRAAAPEGKPASFALIDLSPDKLELVIYNMDGKETKRERAALGTRSKVSVK
jgi:hypothetical protein